MWLHAAVVMTLLCCGFLSFPLIAQQAASTRPLTHAQWREDLKHFARELPKRHRASFTQCLERSSSAPLPTSTPPFHRCMTIRSSRMMRIAAKVGDGHTGVHLPQVLPWIRSACTGSGVSSASLAPRRIYKLAIRKRVVKIGNFDIDEVHARVRTCFPSAENENEWYVMATSPAFITRPEVLHALGIVADRGPAPFTVVDDQGNQSTLTISPVVFPPRSMESFDFPHCSRL